MEGISALMDGELGSHEGEREIARLKTDAELRTRWDEFHLIGDALRGEPVLSSRFAEALSKQLAAEPTVLAPRRLRADARRVTAYAMSAAASLSAAALVAWVALAPQSQENLALKTPAPVVRAEPQRELASVPSEGRMNEYLLAHETFSPSTALQGLAPYIRSVAATRPAERR